MSTEIDEQLLVVQPEDPVAVSSKKPARSYTREFLLSLSELEVCKKLPDGFDASLLSEFEDTCYRVQDRQRFPGSSSLQGFGRTDYGSSGPGRGDPGSYPRGLHRWDSRSSGRSDTDSDSESGRRYGSYTRRPGQNPEHDGLLGSGSFPRPPGYAAAGAPVPRFRPNGNTYLNRSNEPYHPPRPYKAAPHSRREANDSFNDETFGSTDSATYDRVEEEKKRRAEFELMRKEQHKALQEKQKTNSVKVDDPFSEITGLLGNPSDCNIISDSDKLLKQASQDDSGKLPAASPVLPARPLVPPGFVNSVVDKSSTAKPLVHSDQVEVGRMELEEHHQDVKSIAKERGSNEFETTSSSPLKSEKFLDFPSILLGADQTKASSLPDVSEVLENGDIMGLDAEVTGHKLLREPGRSTSILEKLFGNALTTSSGNASNLVEDHDAKTEDIWSPNSLQSKFAQWFLEEEKKPLEDISQPKSNHLLSLIVGGEKGGSNACDVTATGSILAPELMAGHVTSKSAFSTTEILEEIPGGKALEKVKPAVLTCEDLEQSILSEVGENISNSQRAGQENNASDIKAGQVDAAIDNQASLHLLSLLQRGTESKDLASFLVSEKRSPDKPCDPGSRDNDKTDESISINDDEGLNSSGKTLTLEALFGTAFMKELHSAQNNSAAGSARTDVPEPTGLSFLSSHNALFHSSMNQSGDRTGSYDSNNLNSVDGIGEFHKGQWSGFHDSRNPAEISMSSAEMDSKFGRFDGGVDVRLPEEDSLISLSDPSNVHNSFGMPDSGSFSTGFLSSSSQPVNAIEKLGRAGAAFKDERSVMGGQDPMLLRGPYDVSKPELAYQNLHPQPNSPLIHAQVNHGKPLFHPLDSHPAHLDPHLKFIPPEAIMHHDAPIHRQFSGNMSHPPLTHHSACLPGFDHPIPPPILQQMHMVGNLPPHLARGFPGGTPMPPPNHNPANYIQEHNPMQGFPFGQRQSNFGGPGMAPSVPEIGGANNPPEAFQRLLEMELRANPKQMHPFAGGGHNRPMYGHELDMSFRYR